MVKMDPEPRPVKHRPPAPALPTWPRAAARTAPPSVEEALRSGGDRPLDPDVRRQVQTTLRALLREGVVAREAKGVYFLAERAAAPEA